MIALFGLACATDPALVDPTEPPAIATVDDPGPALVDPAPDGTPVDTGAAGPTFTNPVAMGTPDPHVSVHGGQVWLVYSRGTAIVLRRAASLLELGEAEEQTIWVPPPDTLHSADLWGPELHRIDGRYVIYYSATDVSFFGLSSEYRIWALEADGDDPWTATWTHRGPLVVPDQDAVAVHPSVFEAAGARYLVWAGRREGLDFGRHVFVAPLLDAFTVERPGIALVSAEEPWETGVSASVEGPAVVEREGLRALVYAASNCIADERSLGVLVQDAGASPTDPVAWQRRTTPWVESEPVENVFALGQPGFVTSPDGEEDWLVYHAATASFLGCGDDRSLHLNRIHWTKEGPELEGPTGTASPIEMPGDTP